MRASSVGYLEVMVDDLRNANQSENVKKSDLRFGLLNENRSGSDRLCLAVMTVRRGEARNAILPSR